MDLAIKRDNLGRDNQSWLGSAHGTSSCRTITLDASLFVAGTHYPEGYLPSGTAVGKVTATGKYGPYTVGAANGTQTFAGYTLIAVRVAGSTSVVSVPLYEHGRVVVANLPFQSGAGSADATAQASSRIVHV